LLNTMPQQGANFRCPRCGLRGAIDLALPSYDHAPTIVLKQPRNLFVSLDITRELVGPKFGVRLRRRRYLASRMAVPEAAMDEYHRPVFGEHHVRLSRQARPVNAKAKAEAMQRLPQRNLGLRVP
jgi:hypothetical protein